MILHSSNDWKMNVVYWRMHRGTLTTVVLSTLLIDLMNIKEIHLTKLAIACRHKDSSLNKQSGYY